MTAWFRNFVLLASKDWLVQGDNAEFLCRPIVMRNNEH